ncbi:MAG: hypothetical protein ABI378_02390 [Chitinophagaceae bacterium]
MKLTSIFAILAFCFCNFLVQSPLFAQGGNNGCEGISAGYLQFSGQEIVLSYSMAQQLEVLTEQLNKNSRCKVVVSGNSGGSKIDDQKIYQERILAFITLMSDQNKIAIDRFVFLFDPKAQANILMYRAAEPGEAEALPNPE